MSRKSVHVDLSFDIASTTDLPRPAVAAAIALKTASRSAAEAAAEAERRAFADTEPAFMDTQPTDDQV